MIDHALGLFSDDILPHVTSGVAPAYVLTGSEVVAYVTESNLYLIDSSSIPASYVSGALQSFSSEIKNYTSFSDSIFVQRQTSYMNPKSFTDLEFVRLQRLNIYSDKPPATIVWLMRARNTENTRYIYWRSIGSPSSFGISGIIPTSVENVGSVYEQV